jgi:hypothetical protein
VLFAATVVIYVCTRIVPRANRPPLRAWLIPVAIAIVAFAVIWWPPIHQELKTPSGNIQTIRKFFSTPDAGHTWHDAWAIVANSAGTLFQGPLKGALATPARSGATPLLVLLMLVDLAGAIVGWLRRRTFAAALCTLALVGMLGELYAATNIRGELFVYLIQWFSTLTIAAVVGPLIALGPELGPLGRPLPQGAFAGAAALVVLVLVGINLVKLLDHTSLKGDPAYAYADAGSLWRQVNRYVARSGIRDPMISIPSNGQWPYAATVVDQRFRRGEPTAVDQSYLFLFGSEFRSKGHEDATLYFTPAGTPRPKGANVAAQTPSTVVYAVRSRA